MAVGGASAWVGEQAVGGSTHWGSKFWPPYLTETRRLFERNYSAIGFFAHLAESDVDPWSLFDKLFAAAVNPGPLGMTPSQRAYYVAVEAAGERFLDSWPSGCTGGRISVRPGHPGAGITGDACPIGPIAFGVPLQVADGANAVASIDLVTMDVIHLTVSEGRANGLLRTADGAEHKLVDGDLCAMDGGCACPPGVRGAKAALKTIKPGKAYLALTGHVPDQRSTAAGSQVEISGLQIDEYCGPVPPPVEILGPDAPSLVPGKLVLSGAVSAHIPAKGWCTSGGSFSALFDATVGKRTFTLYINLLGVYDGPRAYVLRNAEDAGPIGWSVNLDVQEAGSATRRQWQHNGGAPPPILTSRVTVNKDERSGTLALAMLGEDGNIVQAAGGFTCQKI